MMDTLDARLIRLERGFVEIAFPYSIAVTQQHGYMHAGTLAAIADSACGYAAATLIPPDSEVLTIEFKINLLELAVNGPFLARGRVVRAGRTITVCGRSGVWREL